MVNTSTSLHGATKPGATFVANLDDRVNPNLSRSQHGTSKPGSVSPRITLDDRIKSKLSRSQHDTTKPGAISAKDLDDRINSKLSKSQHELAKTTATHPGVTPVHRIDERVGAKLSNSRHEGPIVLSAAALDNRINAKLLSHNPPRKLHSKHSASLEEKVVTKVSASNHGAISVSPVNNAFVYNSSSEDDPGAVAYLTKLDDKISRKIRGDPFSISINLMEENISANTSGAGHLLGGFSCSSLGSFWSTYSSDLEDHSSRLPTCKSNLEDRINSKIAGTNLSKPQHGATSIAELDRKISRKLGPESLQNRIAAKISDSKSKPGITASGALSNLDGRVNRKMRGELPNDVEKKYLAGDDEDNIPRDTGGDFDLHGFDDDCGTRRPSNYSGPTVPGSAEQAIHSDGKENGIMLYGIRMSKRFLYIVAVCFILASVAGVVLPIVISGQSGGSSSPSDTIVEGSFFATCASDDDCLPSSPLCHRGRCRSRLDDSNCDRLDVCRNVDCPDNGTPCLDANHDSECTEDAQCDGNVCVSGSCLSGEVDTLCGTDDDCLTGLCGDDLLCAKKRPAGSNCTVDNQCESGRCPFGSCTVGQFDDACRDSSQCRSQNCTNNKCAAGVEGSYCEIDEDCDSMLCVAHLNECGAKKDGVETACTVDGDCASGACSFNTCTDGKFNSMCSRNSQCRGGFCQDDLCAPNPPGYWCEEDAGCTSLRCSNNTCLDYLPLGAKCTLHSMCETKFCDTDSSGVCSESREVGQPCSKSEACKSLQCNSEIGVCDESWGEGHPCDPYSFQQRRDQCDPELFCGTSNECVPRLATDSFCQVRTWCSGNTTCLATNLLCGDPLPKGSVCISDYDCESFNCEGVPGNQTCREQIFDVPYPWE